MKLSERPWVVMPLYIYPLTTSTWAPLYDAVGAHPELNFLVVVNPNSGPGDGPLPGDDYIREVPKLNTFPNVLTVGYVRAGWCKRPLKDTIEDIGLFAGWRLHDIPGLYVNGIYLDETPNHISRESTAFLDATTNFIKSVNGLIGRRLVVHNPGTPPEGSLDVFGRPDLVCVCEEPYLRYITKDLQNRLEEFMIPWEQTIFQISGVPAGDMCHVVDELASKGQFVFATDLVDDFYESFGPTWTTFTEAVSRYGSRPEDVSENKRVRI